MWSIFKVAIETVVYVMQLVSAVGLLLFLSCVTPHHLSADRERKWLEWRSWELLECVKGDAVTEIAL